MHLSMLVWLSSAFFFVCVYLCMCLCMRSAIEAWMSLPLFLCVVVGDNSMRKTLDWLLRPVLVRERQKEDGRGMKKKKKE